METKKLGRQPLPDDEKKERIVSFVPRKMVTALTYEQCKTISETAIAAAFAALKPKKK